MGHGTTSDPCIGVISSVIDADYFRLQKNPSTLWKMLQSEIVSHIGKLYLPNILGLTHSYTNPY